MSPRFRSFALVPGLFLLMGCAAQGAPADYFMMEVVDAATGRGIPLVEMETVNHLLFCTDSQGLVAIREPDLMDNRVFFTLHSPGYEVPKDDLGFHGEPLLVKAGASVRIALRRLNVAERLYRLTGGGIYRDSVLLERRVPITEPLLNGSVVGEDSMSAAVFRGHTFWFGGDTLRLRHPLGQYWTSGAISEVASAEGMDPARGINLHYLVDDEGFARPMWPKPKEGAVWTDGLMTLKDEAGHEQLVAHFSHMKSLTQMLAHGVGIFDERKNQFAVAAQLPVASGWRCLGGHPVAGRGVDEGMMLFPAPAVGLAPFPAVRAKAVLAEVERPDGYQAFTYLKPGTDAVERGADGRLVYGWKADAHPVGQTQERELIKVGALSEEEALYQVRDAETGALLEFHAGSVNWNEYRHKWILIAEQMNAKSLFSGEIWYAEADLVVGPWRLAHRVATHEKQSFYNPVHHPFLDQEGGRFIFFEGTYANTAGASVSPTPRYDYNQLMYRLDLSDTRLLPPLK